MAALLFWTTTTTLLFGFIGVMGSLLISRSPHPAWVLLGLATMVTAAVGGGVAVTRGVPAWRFQLVLSRKRRLARSEAPRIIEGRVVKLTIAGEDLSIRNLVGTFRSRTKSAADAHASFEAELPHMEITPRYMLYYIEIADETLELDPRHARIGAFDWVQKGQLVRVAYSPTSRLVRGMELIKPSFL